MTPGGKVGHRAFAAVVRGNDDGMKRRPVALGQAISGFRLLSTGSGSRGKKKGRGHDDHGPGHDGNLFAWLPHKPNYRGPSPGNDQR